MRKLRETQNTVKYNNKTQPEDNSHVVSVRVSSLSQVFPVLHESFESKLLDQRVYQCCSADQ